MADINTYPEDPEIELEASILEIPIHIEGEYAETVTLEATLKLDRDVPARSESGHRSLEFTIQQWEVIGHSEVLDATIVYRLSDVPQPKSVVTSDTPDADFPATIVYSAIHDVYVNGELAATQIPGLGIGRGITQIPPRDVTIGFQKAFELDTPRGLISSGAGACKEMFTLSEEEFASRVLKVQQALGG